MRVQRLALIALVATLGQACASSTPGTRLAATCAPAETSSSHHWDWERATRDHAENLVSDARSLAAAGDHQQALRCLDGAIAGVLSTPPGYEVREGYLDYLAGLIAEAQSLQDAVARQTPGANDRHQAQHTALDTAARPAEPILPPSDFPLVLNRLVGRFLEAATRPGDFRRRLEKGLDRAGTYLPMIRGRLAAAGLPEDLAYLPIVESSFSLTARSTAGARGMWQFMPATARQYGLRVSSQTDDRSDPIRSTEAAVTHLAQLHAEFGDWLLALAAYNSGAGRVRRAMHGAHSADFWHIRRRLPRETRDYVPSFLAAVIVAKRPHRYGFPAISEGPPELPTNAHHARRAATRTLSHDGLYVIRRDDTLWDIARSFNVALDELCAHNTLGRNQVIRPGQAIRVPVLRARPDTPTATHYRVRPGDTLYGIARRFGVSLSALRGANGILGSHIRAGELLRIPSQKVSG